MGTGQMGTGRMGTGQMGTGQMGIAQLSTRQMGTGTNGHLDKWAPALIGKVQMTQLLSSPYENCSKMLPQCRDVTAEQLRGLALLLL